MYGKTWTTSELDYLRRHAGKQPSKDIAAALGRNVCSVYHAICMRGLGRRLADFGPAFIAFLKSKHAMGWSDTEIAAAWKCDRHAVSARRRALGLGDNRTSERFRDKVRANTERQLREAGLPSIGWLRKVAFARRATEAGWPADLRPRAVQILNALWERGPLTRRELADIIGMPWKGPSKSLTSNDPEGSYLAHLMARGLVVDLGRKNRVAGKGSGRSTHVYSLPLWLERGKVG